MSEKKDILSADEFQQRLLELAPGHGASGLDVRGLLQGMISERAKGVIDVSPAAVDESVVAEENSPPEMSQDDLAMREFYEFAYMRIASELKSDSPDEKKQRFMPLFALKAFKEQNLKWAQFTDGKLIFRSGGRPRKRIQKYDSYACVIKPEDYQKVENLDDGLLRTIKYQGENVLFISSEFVGNEIATIEFFQGLASLMERVNDKKFAKEGQQINAFYRVALAGYLAADYIRNNAFSIGAGAFLRKRMINGPEGVTDFLLSCGQTDLEELDQFFSQDACHSTRERMMRNTLYVWALFINSSKSADREKFNFRSLPEDIYRAYRRFSYAKSGKAVP